MQQYETANIKYSGLVDGKMTVTVLDDKKGKWYVWKLDYKDKTKNSDAYDSLLQMKLGDTFGVSYQGKEESFVNDKGQTINFVKKTIYSIMPPITNPTSEMAVSKPTAPKAPVMSNLSEPAYVSEQKDEKFWDKKAYKQCLWNYWLEYITKQTEHRNLTEAEMNGVWSVFNQIEKDADKRFAQGWDKAVKTFGTDKVSMFETDDSLPVEYGEPVDLPF